MDRHGEDPPIGKWLPKATSVRQDRPMVSDYQSGFVPLVKAFARYASKGGQPPYPFASSSRGGIDSQTVA